VAIHALLRTAREAVNRGEVLTVAVSATGEGRLIRLSVKLNRKLGFMSRMALVAKLRFRKLVECSLLYFV